jgi:hypothetical protein
MAAELQTLVAQFKYSQDGGQTGRGAAPEAEAYGPAAVAMHTL